MDTDIFFQEYYEKVRKVKFNGKPILGKIDKCLAVLVVVGLILYFVLLLLSKACPAAIVASISFVIVVYLSIKTSIGKAKKTILENRKNYQHSRFLEIKNMLSSYKIDDDDLIDMLNDSLALNKEKYNYGLVFRTSVKSVIGVMSVILSALSVKTFIEKINENLVDLVFDLDISLQEFLNSIKQYASLIIYVGLLLLLILIVLIEILFVWYSMIKPFIWRKYYYHDEMIADLKAYKLFRKYHEDRDENVSEEKENSTENHLKINKIEDLITKVFNKLNANINPKLRRDRKKKERRRINQCLLYDYKSERSYIMILCLKNANLRVKTNVWIPMIV